MLIGKDESAAPATRHKPPSLLPLTLAFVARPGRIESEWAKGFEKLLASTVNNVSRAENQSVARFWDLREREEERRTVVPRVSGLAGEPESGVVLMRVQERGRGRVDDGLMVGSEGVQRKGSIRHYNPDEKSLMRGGRDSE